MASIISISLTEMVKCKKILSKGGKGWAPITSYPRGWQESFYALYKYTSSTVVNSNGGKPFCSKIICGLYKIINSEISLLYLGMQQFSNIGRDKQNYLTGFIGRIFPHPWSTLYSVISTGSISTHLQIQERTLLLQV